MVGKYSESFRDSLLTDLCFITEITNFSELVDLILLDGDANNDGFLEYAEFMDAKKRHPKNKVFKVI